MSYDEWRPDFSQRLTISIERPVISWADGLRYRYEPGSRTRIVIEGEHDLVAAYQAAIRDVFEVQRPELEA